jgi:DNA-binding GntR family transcriptional regulator
VNDNFLERNNATRRLSIYQTLKNAITFLELKPGSAINEAELVEKFGVSRTPIREALIRLSDDLLVDIYPQRGTYVSKIDLSLTKQLTYMRHVIETDICLNLCSKKADVHIAVAHSMLSMELAVQKKDVVEYILHDDDFHRAIFAYANYEMLWNIISNTRMHYVRFLILDMKLPNSLEESYQEHEKIVEYIAGGNKKELLKLLGSHHDYSTMKREEQIRQAFSDYFV